MRLPSMSGHTSRKSTSMGPRLGFSEEEFNKAKSDIERAWESKRIPVVQRAIFRTHIFNLPRSQAIPIVQKETEALRANRALVQQVIRTINAREDSLNSLISLNTQLIENQSDLKLESAELLHAHRMLTLSVVESILKWRDQFERALLLSNQKPANVPFMWNGQNYLSKIKNDLDFLPGSEIAKLFHISHTLDPLILYPSQSAHKPGKSKNNVFVKKSGDVVIPLPKILLSRLRAAEKAIFDEDPNNVFVVDIKDTIDEDTLRMLSEEIYDQLVENGIIKNLNVVIKETKTEYEVEDAFVSDHAQQISDLLLDQLSKEIAVESAEELKNDLLAEEIYASFCDLDLIATIDETVAEILASDSELISDEIFDSLLGKIIQELVQASYEEELTNCMARALEITTEEIIEEVVQENLKDTIEIAKTDIENEETNQFGLAENIINSLVDELTHPIASDLMEEIMNHCTIDSLFESIIDFEVKSTVDESVSNSRLLHPESINEDIFDSLVLPIINELAESEYSEEREARKTLHSALESSIHEIVEESVQKNLNDIIFESKEELEEEKSDHNTRLCEDILYSIINEISAPIASESIENCENDYVSESVYEAMLETELKEMACELISTLESSDSQMIYEDTYNALLSSILREIVETEYADEELLDEAYNSIMDLSLREIIDESMQEPLNDEDSPQDLLEKLNLDFGHSMDLSDLSMCNFIPLSIDYSLVPFVLQEYYAYIPETLRSSVEPIDILLKESSIHNNPCWFWAKKYGKIIGLLVYSENSQFTASLAVTIHHLSCVNMSGYGSLLEKTEDFIMNRESCDSLRFDLFSENSVLSREVKSVFSQKNYRWKTNLMLSQGEITVFGKDIEKKHDLKNDAMLSSKCSIFCIDQEVTENTQTDENITKIASRGCLLSSLLEFFPREDMLLPLDTLNRLQNEVSDSLAIIDAMEGFSFAKIETKKRSTQEGKQVTSTLNLEFKWVGCTHLIYQPLDIAYKYFLFHSDAITHSMCETADIYMLPTSEPTLKAFFLVAPDIRTELRNDARNFKTDISYKAEGILRSADMEVSSINELWVPAFYINAFSKVNWLEGFNIPSDDLYVEKCQEFVEIRNEPRGQKEGILNYSPNRIIDRSFIFGIIDTDANKVLEGPVIVALIQEKDWIKC